MSDKIGRYLQLRKLCSNCRKCSISIGDNRVSDPHVFGCGNGNARVMVVGQNPGYTETVQKKPFVGDAGKNFDSFLTTLLGISRQYVYITNTVKCYTPGNRPPTDEEIEACRDFLREEIAIIQPKIILVLGNYALHYFTKHGGISGCHGKIERSQEFNVDVFPMYHPSPLNMNKEHLKIQTEQDFLKLKTLLQKE